MILSLKHKDLIIGLDKTKEQYGEWRGSNFPPPHLLRRAVWKDKWEKCDEIIGKNEVGELGYFVCCWSIILFIWFCECVFYYERNHLSI